MSRILPNLVNIDKINKKIINPKKLIIMENINNEDWLWFDETNETVKYGHKYEVYDVEGFTTKGKELSSETVELPSKHIFCVDEDTFEYEGDVYDKNWLAYKLYEHIELQIDSDDEIEEITIFLS